VYLYSPPCLVSQWMTKRLSAMWRHQQPHRTYSKLLGRGHTILTSRELMWCYACSCERRFEIEFSGADSHFCHSAYVTWSHVKRWSAHVPARLCRTHFVSHEVTWPHVSRNLCDNRNMRGVLARGPTRAPREITWRKRSDRSVNLRHGIQCQIASHIPTARITSHELT
jgi:hypothetical protein